MATGEMNTEGARGEKMLAPPEDDFTPGIPMIPLNFCELTPSQFGISVQSFTPSTLSNRKDKSRLAQLKARRKSSIGARGSPETNSLIRFIAQQRSKTPPTSRTPQLVGNSPFPRVASTLRQKMASFQSLMDVEEGEICDPMASQDGNTGRCIKTRDYLSEGECHAGGKENDPPRMTPSKRRRPANPPSCEEEIREASAPIVHFSLKEQEENKEPVTRAVMRGTLPASETVQEASAALISPPIHVDFELQARSPSDHQQDSVFEFQNPNRTPLHDSAATPPARPAFTFRIPTFPPFLAMKPTGEDDSGGASSTVKSSRKKVRFGGPLSPELFDRDLPPSTPLQKGAAPARAATPGDGLRSLLKTPQRSESRAAAAHAPSDPRSPSVIGASPTLPTATRRRRHSVHEDTEETEGKIVFPSMEEIDSAVTTETENAWEVQPLNLNITFYEESLSQSMTEPDTEPSTASQAEVLHQPEPLPEPEPSPETEQTPVEAPAPAPTRSRTPRKKQAGQAEGESTSEAPARSSRKRKHLDESEEPVQRSTRSAAKSASVKMKKAAATRRWNKEVDRSLYGSRDYASKDPTLSPINETLPSISQAIASASCTETNLNPEVASDAQDASEEPATSPDFSKVSTTRKGRRPNAGPKAKVTRIKKRKVSVGSDVLVTQDQPERQTEDYCEDQTTINTEESREAPLAHIGAGETGDDGELVAQTAAGAHCTDTLGLSECLSAPASDRQPSTETSNMTLPLESAQQKATRGRKCSVNSSDMPPEDQTEENQLSPQMEEEKGQGEPSASQQETVFRSGSGDEGGASNWGLAPWQADFNTEDVFKPVATRGQRSVRRSLRNRSNMEAGSSSSSSAGLAWLPRTPPDPTREARRRTRGRRLSAVQPSMLEETHDHVS